MKIYCSRQPEIDQFIGKDIWVRIKNPSIHPRFPDEKVFVRILSKDRESGRNVYRYNIVYISSKSISDNYFNKPICVHSFGHRIYRPIETYTTEEILDMISNTKDYLDNLSPLYRQKYNL